MRDTLCSWGRYLNNKRPLTDGICWVITPSADWEERALEIGIESPLMRTKLKSVALNGRSPCWWVEMRSSQILIQEDRILWVE